MCRKFVLSKTSDKPSILIFVQQGWSVSNYQGKPQLITRNLIMQSQQFLSRRIGLRIMDHN